MSNDRVKQYPFTSVFVSILMLVVLTVSGCAKDDDDPIVVPPVVCDSATEVLSGNRCYYLDGSGGACATGYELAPESILTTIAADFVGKTYKTTQSDNCCIWHATQGTDNQNWGMNADCNQPGPFTEGPVLGGASCTGALNTNPAQLTLCVTMP